MEDSKLLTQGTKICKIKDLIMINIYHRINVTKEIYGVLPDSINISIDDLHSTSLLDNSVVLTDVQSDCENVNTCFQSDFLENLSDLVIFPKSVSFRSLRALLDEKR